MASGKRHGSRSFRPRSVAADPHASAERILRRRRRRRRIFLQSASFVLIFLTAIHGIWTTHRKISAGDGDIADAVDRAAAGLVERRGKSTIGVSSAIASAAAVTPKGQNLDPITDLGPNAAPGAVLPNVLLIGGQKSGTTAVAAWLFQLKEVCGPRRFPGEPEHFDKETQFLDRPERYSKGTKFWATRFEHCRGSGGENDETEELALVLDATPNFLPFPERARAVYDRLGDEASRRLKILLILRDPASRELSLYNHKANLFRFQMASQENFWRNAVGDDGKLLPFGKFVNDTVLHRMEAGLCERRKFHRMQCYGMYAKHLRRWMELFRHEQILVLSYDELATDPAALMRRMRAFLGLEDSADNLEKNVIPPKNEQSHDDKLALMPCGVRDRLDEAFREANEQLYELLANKDGPEMEQRPFPKFKPAACALE